MDDPLPYNVNDIAITSDTKAVWEWDMETGKAVASLRYLYLTITD